MAASQSRIQILPERKNILLAVISGVLLAIAFPDFNYNLTAWFALVPLLFALESGTYRQVYLTGLVTGMVGIGLGFYWVSSWVAIVWSLPVTIGGVLVFLFAFSFGQIFGIIAMLYRWTINNSKLEELIVFPLVLCSVFSVFPLLFPFRLGESQWQIPISLQLLDVTGITGLDLVIALSNVLVYKLFTPSRRFVNFWLVFPAVLIVAGWFGIGWFKLGWWESEIKNWNSVNVGLVQPNRTPTLNRPMPDPGYTREYPLEMALSEKLVNKKADLIIWPEGHFYGFTFWDSVKESFQSIVKHWNTPLVFYDATRRTINHEKKAYNSILFLNRRGELVDIYDKMKLVPFGEHIPFLGDLPLFDWILGDYLDNLTPGTEAKIVEVGGMRLVPKTCYEPLYPEFVADSINFDGSGKVIIVQSQNGWFGKTSQPFQHMAVTVMRAVENRVPLIHVIQNGPSGVILPSGKIEFLSDAFARGSWMVKMPYNSQSGGSFYSRNPRLFENSVRIGFLAVLLFALFKRRRNQRKS